MRAGSGRPDQPRGKAAKRGIALLLAAVCLVAGSMGAQAAGFTDPDTAIHELADACVQRLALMREVAAYKWLHRLPVTDPPREQQLLDGLAAKADLAGLEVTTVRRFFAANLELAKLEQRRRHAQWAERGFDFEGAPRDLADELRPRIDQMNDSLLRWLVLVEPAIAASGDSARYGPAFASAFRTAGVEIEGQWLTRLVSAAMGVRRARPPDLAAIRALGMLRVGLTGDYAPFSRLVAGELTGLDVDLAHRLARRLGVELRFIHTSWPTLSRDLAAGNFDIAMGGITRTEERARIGAFAMPYHSGGKTPVARCGEVAAYDTLAELREPRIRLIVNPGGTNERFIRTRLAGATPIVFPDNTGIPGELLGGRADVMITDDIEADLWQRRYPGLCRTTAATFTTDQKAFLMVQDPALVGSVDAWLEPLVADGRVAQWLQHAVERAAAQ